MAAGAGGVQLDGIVDRCPYEGNNMVGLVDCSSGKIRDDLMACVFVTGAKALVNVSPDPSEQI